MIERLAAAEHDRADRIVAEHHRQARLLAEQDVEVLQRPDVGEPLTAGALARCLLRYPAMTLKVVVAIHWQALLIWCKRNPVYDHPNKHRGATP